MSNTKVARVKVRPSQITNDLNEYLDAMKISRSRAKTVTTVTPVYHSHSHQNTIPEVGRLSVDDITSKQNIYLSIINNNYESNQTQTNLVENDLARMNLNLRSRPQFTTDLRGIRCSSSSPFHFGPGQSKIKTNVKADSLQDPLNQRKGKIVEGSKRYSSSVNLKKNSSEISFKGDGDNVTNRGIKLEQWRPFGPPPKFNTLPMKAQDSFTMRTRQIDPNRDAIPKSKATGRVLKTTEHFQHVFAINGSALQFKQLPSKGFINWFDDESNLSPSVKKVDIWYKFDLSGFTNQEITMKLYEGNKFIIEADRPCRRKYSPKTVKYKIVLPKGISVESLFLSRNSLGHLIVRKSVKPESHGLH